MTENTCGDFYPYSTTAMTTVACTDNFSSSTYWVNTYPYINYTDNSRKAFNIVKKMQEKKIVELKTAKQFSDLMEAILEIL